MGLAAGARRHFSNGGGKPKKRLHKEKNCSHKEKMAPTWIKRPHKEIKNTWRKGPPHGIFYNFPMRGTHDTGHTHIM